MIFKHLLKAIKSVLGSRHLYYSNTCEILYPRRLVPLKVFYEPITASGFLLVNNQHIGHCSFSLMIQS